METFKKSRAGIFLSSYRNGYLCVCVCVRAPLPTYGDEDMDTHQNCGDCSVTGDIFESPEKRPHKSAFYGF